MNVEATEDHQPPLIRQEAIGSDFGTLECQMLLAQLVASSTTNAKRNSKRATLSTAAAQACQKTASTISLSFCVKKESYHTFAVDTLSVPRHRQCHLQSKHMKRHLQPDHDGQSSILHYNLGNVSHDQ